MISDPFDTAGLRSVALSAWRVSPARFREDANTEEDYAHGFYRDRVLVDLAQNGADAATRAGAAGRLLIRLDGTTLIVSNTGEALDAEGVAALATMRASAKRDQTGTVGRFGVGFAATRAVADDVEMRSVSGGVRFSLTATRVELAHSPELAVEVARREERLPVLRLPYPAAEPPEPGYDTSVVLRLRDDDAVEAVQEQLARIDDALLIALPGLVEIVIETPTQVRRIADVDSRWVVKTAEGDLDWSVMVGRPVEERHNTRWRVTWALPRSGDQTWSKVAHAPTPTDDPVSAPGLLVATLPVDPTRRRVALDDAVTDTVLTAAGKVYADLATDLVGAGADISAMVPTGLSAGELDVRLTEAVISALRDAPILAGVAGPRAPKESLALAGSTGYDRALTDALAYWIPALVATPRGGLSPLRALDVPVLSLAEAIDALPVQPGPWETLYRACASVVNDHAEALSGLPVPLADGRIVRGPRGVVILESTLDLATTTLEALGAWGLRVVDPAVSGPVLERLGATRPSISDLLNRAEVRAAILELQADPDGSGLDDIAGAVLDMVRADPPQEAIPVLGLVELPAADGDLVPAHGLVIRGSLANDVFDERVLAPVGDDVVDRFGEQTLLAVGVRSHLVSVQIMDVIADPDGLDLDGTNDAALLGAGLDGWPDFITYLAEKLGEGAWVGDVTAVADLDAVREQSWSEVLAAIADTPELRSALLEPVRTSSGDAWSYTMWWLIERSELGLGGPFALEGEREWLPSIPPVLAGVDESMWRAFGGVESADEVDLAGWSWLLSDFPDGAAVGTGLAIKVWRAWAAIGPHDQLPELVPAWVPGGQIRMVPTATVVIADEPMWCQRTDLGPILPVPHVTGFVPPSVCVAADIADGHLDDLGQAEALPEALVAVTGYSGWRIHDDLMVDGVSVEWWVDSDGEVHAVHLAGLAAGLGQATNRWTSRWAIEAVLLDPERISDLIEDQIWANHRTVS